MKTITDEMCEAINGEFLKKFAQIELNLKAARSYAKQASILMCGDESHKDELISVMTTHLDNGGNDQDSIIHYMESNWLSHQADLMIKQQEDKGGI